MTAREYSLFELLALNQGRAVPRPKILKEVWGSEGESTSNIVDVYINYLRKPFTPEQVKEHVIPVLEARYEQIAYDPRRHSYGRME